MPKILLFILMVAAPLVPADPCQPLLEFDTKAYDPRAALLRAGLDPDKIELHFKRESFNGEAPSMELVIRHKDTHLEIGSMSVWAIDSTQTDIQDIWRTDTSGVGHRGVGLGQMMYLMMAAKFFISYPKFRLISPDHSGLANDMWERLVVKGFARKFSFDYKTYKDLPPDEKRGVLYEIVPTSLGKPLKDFVRQFKIKTGA